MFLLIGLSWLQLSCGSLRTIAPPSRQVLPGSSNTTMRPGRKPGAGGEHRQVLTFGVEKDFCLPKSVANSVCFGLSGAFVLCFVDPLVGF